MYLVVPEVTITLSNPIDVPNAIAVGLVGFIVGIISGILVTYGLAWLQRPRVQFLGFTEDDKFNLGSLYRFRFRLKGSTNPGLSCLQIQWPEGSVLGKWDEAPNPLANDRQFKPELVPATFYQPLFFGKEYSIPVIIKPKGKEQFEVFSGRWFGQGLGYGTDPRIGNPQITSICLTLFGGGGLIYCKDFKVSDIVG